MSEEQGGNLPDLAANLRNWLRFTAYIWQVVVIYLHLAYYHSWSAPVSKYHTVPYIITLKAMKYVSMNHGDQRVFSIWNHYKYRAVATGYWHAPPRKFRNLTFQMVHSGGILVQWIPDQPDRRLRPCNIVIIIFCFIWIPMLWACCLYNVYILSPLDMRIWRP